MDDAERELVQAAQRGDSRAIATLLEKHEEQVFRFGLRMCGSEEDARDVLQETMLAAFRTLGDFRGEAALSTWLFQLARSFCSRSRRPSTGAVPSGSLPLDAPEVANLASMEATPDSRAHARQMGELLSAALTALPEKSREVILLRDVEGLSAEQAAKVVGIEVGALKSRLHRARLELRSHLASVLEGQEEVGCPELAEELAAYSGEDIDRSTCERIEQHLSRCEKCRASCEGLRRTVSLCRALPEGKVPASVRAAVRRAVMEAMKR